MRSPLVIVCGLAFSATQFALAAVYFRGHSPSRILTLLSVVTAVASLIAIGHAKERSHSKGQGS